MNCPCGGTGSCAATGGATATFITPAGDPVNQPLDAGTNPGSTPDGANEFTFSTASTGVLTMNLKATVTGYSSLSAADKASYVFELDAISGSTFAWDTNNQNGTPANPSGDTLTATATYTGLPADNSAFGLKKARIKKGSSVEAEASFEVFFPRDETNHPVSGPFPDGTPKNWFVYWLQTVTPLGPNPQIVYKNSGGNQYNMNLNKIFIVDSIVTPYNAAYGVNNPLKGIDHFGWTIIHESQHYKDWVDYWNVDNQGVTVWQAGAFKEGPDDDKDRDHLPNRIEDINLSKTFDAGDLYDWAVQQTPGSYVNDFEDYDCKRNTSAKGDHSKDWGDPGMQHKTLGTYDD